MDKRRHDGGTSLPISTYLKNIREKVGHALLLLPAVAAIVLNENGHILFQKRSNDGLWSLPAGAIEPDETPAQSIVREVEEETGLIVAVERILGVFGGKDFTCTYPNGDIVQYSVIVFLCRIESGTLESRDGESAELHFLPVSQVPVLQVPYPKELFMMECDQPLFH
jgi:mutator protein MutT